VGVVQRICGRKERCTKYKEVNYDFK